MASLRLPISHPEVEVDFLARGRPYRNAHVILPKHFPMRVAGVCLHARKVRIEVAHLDPSLTTLCHIAAFSGLRR
ncbi:MAG: hypothetical protein ABTR92_02425, partial [Candidatus Accumulibacter phosphatis]